MNPTTLLLPLLSLCLTALAQGAPADHTPSCVLPCVTANLNVTDCPPANQTCLCRDDAFQQSVGACVFANCSVRDALFAKNQTWTECGFPVHNEFRLVKIVRISFFCIFAGISAILRSIVKVARLSTWGPDDVTILIAFCLLCGVMATVSFSERAGVGKDFWSLTIDQAINANLSFYLGQILYVPTLGLIKSSIMFMTFRIFLNETFRKFLWATQVFNLMLTVAMLLVFAFQCHPVSLAWTYWLRESDGWCFDVRLIGIVYGAFHLAVDVWMLALPATQIWSLNMKWRRKLAVTLMFSLGLFLTVVSAVRLKWMVSFDVKSANMTVQAVFIATWSDVELFVGFFTACIPTTRLFIIGFILKRSEKPERSIPLPPPSSRPAGSTGSALTSSKATTNLETTSTQENGPWDGVREPPLKTGLLPGQS